jgi:hypothetical protein
MTSTTDARYVVVDALIAALRAHPNLADTQVEDHEPGGLRLEDNALWLDDVEGISTSVVASVAGRHARDDRFRLTFILWVAWRDDFRPTIDRATEIIAAVEDVLADDPELGIPEVCIIAEVTNKNGPKAFETPNDGHIGGATIEVEVHTRLL